MWHHMVGLREGSPQGLSALKLQESFISLNKSRLLVETAAPHALQPSIVLCCKEGLFPPQCGMARQGPHWPRMQLAQGASLAPQHKWTESPLRHS